jgi:LytS/YehU family sensor histidine kinase
MKPLTVATIAIFVALSVGTNYALASFYNVKLMDFFAFVSGVIFGPFVGIFVGVLSWSVYGVLNPYGFVPQVWVATMLSEAIYGVAGGLLCRANVNFADRWFSHSVFLGNLGFFLTLVYDLITTLVYAQVFGVNVFVALALGAPFTLMHEISNALLFGFCSVPLISAIHATGARKIADFDK